MRRKRGEALTVDGVTRSFEWWSKTTGIPVHTLVSRVHRGWSDEQAVRVPLGQRVRSQSKTCDVCMQRGHAPSTCPVTRET